jgi:hypothetical protein
MSVTPPIPAEADLRHMPSYMIDVKSLLDSDLAAFGDPAANWYAVLSWCASLHQIPAGSLPDDDAKLAYLVRLGRDIRTWKKFREKGALRGWVLHSDGRLYHPVVTEKVLDLLHVSRAGKAGGLASGAVRAAKKISQPIENAQAMPNDRSGSASSGIAKSLKQNGNNRREGKGIEEKRREEETGLTAGANANLPALFGPGQTPIASERPAKKQRTARRSQLPSNWKLSDEDWKYAADKGFLGSKIEQMEEAFRNNHLGKGTVMARIDGYWRTWVNNEIKWYGAPNGTGGAAQRAPAARLRASDTAIEGIFEGMGDPRERGR